MILESENCGSKEYDISLSYDSRDYGLINFKEPNNIHFKHIVEGIELFESLLFAKRNEAHLDKLPLNFENINLFTESKLYLHLGHLHLLTEQYPQALSAYQQCCQLDESYWKDSIFLYGLALVYFHFGAFDLATNAFLQTLYVDPNFERANEIHLRLGIIYKIRGSVYYTLKHFQLALLDENETPLSVSPAQIYFHIAHLLETRGFITLSKQIYEKIVSAPHISILINKDPQLCANLDNPNRLENLTNTSKTEQQYVPIDGQLKADALRQIGWLFHTFARTFSTNPTLLQTCPTYPDPYPTTTTTSIENETPKNEKGYETQTVPPSDKFAHSIASTNSKDCSTVTNDVYKYAKIKDEFDQSNQLGDHPNLIQDGNISIEKPSPNNDTKLHPAAKDREIANSIQPISISHIENTAIKLLQSAISLDPTSGQTWYYLGRCFANLGKIHDAFISYRHSIDKSEGSADTWCSIGVLYQQQNQPMDALQAYICAIQLNKKFTPAWTNLALLYETCNMPRDALTCYANAIKGGDPNPALLARVKKLKDGLLSGAYQHFLSVPKGKTALPNIEEAWNLPIPAELTSRQNADSKIPPFMTKYIYPLLQQQREMRLQLNNLSSVLAINNAATMPAQMQNQHSHLDTGSELMDQSQPSQIKDEMELDYPGETTNHQNTNLLNQSNINVNNTTATNMLFGDELGSMMLMSGEDGEEESLIDPAVEKELESLLGLDGADTKSLFACLNNTTGGLLPPSNNSPNQMMTSSTPYNNNGIEIGNGNRTENLDTLNQENKPLMIGNEYEDMSLKPQKTSPNKKDRNKLKNGMGPIKTSNTAGPKNECSKSNEPPTYYTPNDISQILSNYLLNTNNSDINLKSNLNSTNHLASTMVGDFYTPSFLFKKTTAESKSSTTVTSLSLPVKAHSSNNTKYTAVLQNLKVNENTYVQHKLEQKNILLAPIQMSSADIYRNCKTAVIKDFATALSNIQHVAPCPPPHPNPPDPIEWASNLHHDATGGHNININDTNNKSLKMIPNPSCNNVKTPLSDTKKSGGGKKDSISSVFTTQQIGSSEDISKDVPTIHVAGKKQAHASDLKTFCLSHPMALIKGLSQCLKLDLGLYSTKTLVKTHPDHLIEVRAQAKYPLHKNYSDLRTGRKTVWKCVSTRHFMPLLKYAKYQGTSFKKALEEEKNNKSHAIDPTEGNEDGKLIKDIPPFKKILFGTNVDLSDPQKWADQLQELNKLPNFLKVNSLQNNMLSHLGHTVLGMNSVQLYMKVPGCRTPGHRENLNFCSVNINIGPGDTEWFGVQDEYWGALVDLCTARGVDFLKGSWWPGDLSELDRYNIPYMTCTQRPGDVVWINAGTVHWVQASGWCNNIAWNVGPITSYQYESAMLHYEWNKLQQYKSLVPMIHLSWALVRNVKITEKYLFQLLKSTLHKSLRYIFTIREILSYLPSSTHQSNLSTTKLSSKNASESTKNSQTNCPVLLGKEIIFHGVAPGEMTAHYCDKCETETFNLLFVQNASIVHCFECARRMSPDLHDFVVLELYKITELISIYDNFVLSGSNVSSKPPMVSSTLTGNNNQNANITTGKTDNIFSDVTFKTHHLNHSLNSQLNGLNLDKLSEGNPSLWSDQSYYDCNSVNDNMSIDVDSIESSSLNKSHNIVSNKQQSQVNLQQSICNQTTSSHSKPRKKYVTARMRNSLAAANALSQTVTTNSNTSQTITTGLKTKIKLMPNQAPVITETTVNTIHGKNYIDSPSCVGKELLGQQTSPKLSHTLMRTPSGQWVKKESISPS